MDMDSESFLLKSKDKKSYIEAISSLAYSSKASYQSVLHRFEEFCNQNYNGRTTDEVIKELRTIPIEFRDDAYFGLLQDYVNWLVGRNLSSHTISNNFKVVNQYFSYQGIKASPSDLRRNIKRPKEVKEKLHPLTLEEIHMIFAHSAKKRRMLYLVLIGTGMRIRECISLRKRDFDMNFPKRIKVEIPAQCTKTKAAHTTFVSKEASKYLIPHLDSLELDDLVFARNQMPYHASMTEIEAFSRSRNDAGLTAKYTSANRHLITLHSFRSYFFTRARKAHDTDIAHGMVGHTTYLGMYDRKDDLEKLQLYLKVEPMLRINFQNASEALEEEKITSAFMPRLKAALQESNRIQSINEFNMRISVGEGFIFITDRKKGHKFHKPSCAWLKGASFLQKVVKNRRKNGSYYWCSESDYAKTAFRFKTCQVCIG